MSLPVYVVCPGCGAIVAPGEARLVFEKVQYVVENLDTGGKTVYPSDSEIQNWLGGLKRKYESVDVRVDESAEERVVEHRDPETGEKKVARIRTARRRYTASCKPYRPRVEKRETVEEWRCPRCGRVLLVLRRQLQL